MVFKINVGNKGKTFKVELDNEDLVGTSIGDKIDGKLVSKELEGYELEVTGTSDKAGFPGFREHKGPALKKVLLTYGPGMHKRPKGLSKKSDKPKGLRLRKTIRGAEISLNTIQVNTKVTKEGSKKFSDLFKTEESSSEEKKE